MFSEFITNSSSYVFLDRINSDFDGCIASPNDMSISIFFEILSMHDFNIIFMVLRSPM